MKLPTSVLMLVLMALTTPCDASRLDSLLQTLDRTIALRAVYSTQKERTIEDMKQRRTHFRTIEEQYDLNNRIAGAYRSFVRDSAESYILRNLEIARRLDNSDYISESLIQQAFVFSLSGFFVQAGEIFDSIDYFALPSNLKAMYCWYAIRYYENLGKYTADDRFEEQYAAEIVRLRDEVMTLMPKNSDEHRKEQAFKLQKEGRLAEAIAILQDIFAKERPDTHSYAMSSMNLAKAYRVTGDRALENEYLARAAIVDTRLAVKENEALLTLATNLSEQGDINRAYNYIGAAVDDANFYNSRFRNTVIARVHPIIESNYLRQIARQRRNLQLYAVLASILVIALAATLWLYWRHSRVVAKARRHLREMNTRLVKMNDKLNESNVIKERYIGYFMNQCAIYINKLDDYRKSVNHKVRNGQFDRLYQPSSKALEKDVEELCGNFDSAFLNLYPDFVEQFNALLSPGDEYTVDEGCLNTELRIFALIRLGITDVGQIANFLRYSPQTIYNYRSKVRGKARGGGDEFERRIRKLGSPTSRPDAD